MVKEYWEDVEGRDGSAKLTGPDARVLVAIPALEALLPKDLRGVRALDACCGEGARAAALAKRGASVAIMNDSEGVLNDCFQRLAMEGLHADLVIGSPDAKSDIPVESFDLVVGGEEMLDIKDLGKALLNLQRAMRPGGALVLALPHPVLGSATTITGERGARQLVVRDYFSPEGRGPRNRTLADYINPLARAGLVLESVLEPRPPERLKKTGRTNWAFFDRVPQYLVLVARKPGHGAAATKLAWISRALENGG